MARAGNGWTVSDKACIAYSEFKFIQETLHLPSEGCDMLRMLQDEIRVRLIGPMRLHVRMRIHGKEGKEAGRRQFCISQ